ncbi:MAG: hypothetical protein QM639_07400 [Rhodocyclaceae bacterium]
MFLATCAWAEESVAPSAPLNRDWRAADSTAKYVPREYAAPVFEPAPRPARIQEGCSRAGLAATALVAAASCLTGACVVSHANDNCEGGKRAE